LFYWTRLAAQAVPTGPPCGPEWNRLATARITSAIGSRPPERIAHATARRIKSAQLPVRSQCDDARRRSKMGCVLGPPGRHVAGAGRTLYVYDGLGNRVQKVDQTGHATTYVYDAFGDLAAEYDGTPSSVNSTQYVTVDALGSTRLVIAGAQASERHDFEPFGRELDASTWRGQVAGYAPGDVRQKFTGQERDGESMLDFFQARYFTGAQGRFLSPDPGNAGASLADPQSWNGYAYVSNNPLTFTDPTGLGIWSWIVDTTKDLGNILFRVRSLGQSGLPGYGRRSNPGVNNGPWNEQAPIGGAGGPLNTGTVFGSGNTGPYVFSILQASGSAANMAEFNSALAYLSRDPGMALIISQLRKSSTVYHVTFTNQLDGSFDHKSKEIVWNPFASSRISGGCASAAFILGHELAHAAGWDSSWLGVSYLYIYLL